MRIVSECVINMHKNRIDVVNFRGFAIQAISFENMNFQVNLFNLN